MGSNKFLLSTMLHVFLSYYHALDIWIYEPVTVSLWLWDAQSMFLWFCEPYRCVVSRWILCYCYHALCIVNLIFSWCVNLIFPSVNYLIIYTLHQCRLLIKSYIYIHRFKVFVAGSIHRSKTNEPAVQPVLNGWTIEPLNRRPRRFDLRSGLKNYVRSIAHSPGDRYCWGTRDFAMCVPSTSIDKIIRFTRAYRLF
jgi:hypothetical protein